MQTAKIYTNKGLLEFELFEDDAPNTVAHFCQLVREKFYQGMAFHVYIPGVLIQTGCPDGDGAGFPGYLIKCELNGEMQRHDKGILSMANAGRNTNGSQFFICLDREGVTHLDGNHTCFGKMREGWDVLDRLRKFDYINNMEIGEVDETIELDVSLRSPHYKKKF